MEIQRSCQVFGDEQLQGCFWDYRMEVALKL